MNLEITEILYIYFNTDLTLDSNVDGSVDGSFGPSSQEIDTCCRL